MRLRLRALIDRYRRRSIGRGITGSYRRLPQTDDELAGLDEATRALVEEEPWRD
ncbi:MAG: hypothetical protein ACYDH6_04095 [Acidimicrobiales bacterium]